MIAEVTQEAEGRYLFPRLMTDAFKIKAEKRILRKETGMCSFDGGYFMRKLHFLARMQLTTGGVWKFNRRYSNSSKTIMCWKPVCKPLASPT